MARIQVGTSWVAYDPQPFEVITYDPKANASVEYYNLARECVCRELGATGPGQRHALCRVHNLEEATR